MGNWISQDTAILVIHGIGHQKPLETLDEFAATLIESYTSANKINFHFSHEVATKPRSGKGFWYDNFIRVEKDGSPHHLDIYEYYWANMTEGKAKSSDINRWVQGVVQGARTFYSRKKEMLEKETDSFFKKNGKFLAKRYKFFLTAATRLIPLWQTLINGILFLLSKVPVIGSYFQNWLKNRRKQFRRNFENVVGDIVVYNSLDAKSKFYEVRKTILDGAVSALRYLLEPTGDGDHGSQKYGRVLVAGHSLGSQIAFDAINRITHHVNQGNVHGYKPDGTVWGRPDQKISDILSGLVTFGSPLDKIAFFLWEEVDDKQALKKQMLKNFHSFKQQDNGKKPDGVPELQSPFNRLFDSIRWYNFHDDHDYVSGELDFYINVRNINCHFQAGWTDFTHSRYWRHGPMFEQIISRFLAPEKPPTHRQE